MGILNIWMRIRVVSIMSQPLYPSGRTSSQWVAGCMGPRFGLGALEKIKICCPCLNWIDAAHENIFFKVCRHDTICVSYLKYSDLLCKAMLFCILAVFVAKVLKYFPCQHDLYGCVTHKIICACYFIWNILWYRVGVYFFLNVMDFVSRMHFLRIW